ncbi:hypothetical protein BC835DRAFT_1064801 [Cytidiella melzeri]|nr:hypothetical protein BC835DRAFT_1064801 [Cytidiella melzeri]
MFPQPRTPITVSRVLVGESQVPLPLATSSPQPREPRTPEPCSPNQRCVSPQILRIGEAVHSEDTGDKTGTRSSCPRKQ